MPVSLQLLSVGFMGEVASGQTDFTPPQVKSLSQTESSEATSIRPPGATGSGRRRGGDSFLR